MKIYVGNDHAGVLKKKQIVSFLTSLNHEVIDLGSQDSTSFDDYVDYANAVAQSVVKSRGTAKGILLCGTGTGMVIAANKVAGVRAGLCYDLYTAKKAREDNDANILCLRSRGVSTEKLKPVVKTWLQTKFSRKTRHKRRIQKIKRLEK
jgi:ribose 5-phosphate isomerase B